MKRWTIRIVLVLILGAVTTVAVAWGLALSIPLTDAYYTFGGGPPQQPVWLVAEDRRVGALLLTGRVTEQRCTGNT